MAARGPGRDGRKAAGYLVPDCRTYPCSTIRAKPKRDGVTDFVIVSVPNLTRDDARVRAELLRVESYDVVLDLTDGGGAPSDRTFRSTTVITFAATRQGASTFVDIVADESVGSP